MNNITIKFGTEYKPTKQNAVNNYFTLCTDKSSKFVEVMVATYWNAFTDVVIHHSSIAYISICMKFE